MRSNRKGTDSIHRIRGIHILTQIDVELKSAIIEVTSEAKYRKIDQTVTLLSRSANPEGKRVIVFSPGGGMQEGLRKEIEAVGGRVAESWAELDRLVGH